MNMDTHEELSKHTKETMDWADLTPQLALLVEGKFVIIALALDAEALVTQVGQAVAEFQPTEVYFLIDGYVARTNAEEFAGYGTGTLAKRFADGDPAVYEVLHLFAYDGVELEMRSLPYRDRTWVERWPELTLQEHRRQHRHDRRGHPRGMVEGHGGSTPMTNIVEDMLKRAFKDMDPHTGMFPEEWTCQRCGKKLDADGGHPAERYAGTYNGLCYACTGAGPFVVSVATIDGAQEVSWPPHCPSWRRNRETFFGYTDCEFCGGLGAKRGYWPNPHNRCTECSQRYHGHHDREWYWARLDLLRRVADVRFQRELTAAGLKVLGVKRASRKKIAEAIGTLTEAELNSLRVPILMRYNALRDRLQRHGDRIYATAPPAVA